MSSARQLFFHDIQTEPLIRYEKYVENMRPIRGYPDWWRIRDDVSFIDGPENDGSQYTREQFIWRAEILKDEEGLNSDTFELLNPTSASEPVEVFAYTSVIDSISLEFDQLGRRLIAFESNGDILFQWFDPVASMRVTSNYGAGYNPFIVTASYLRTSGSAASERLLFYVKTSTNQIAYRRQNDRYEVEYALPSAPAPIVELLKVSKNLYGGLTALYCYDNLGELEVGSFTASAGDGVLSVGTDGNILSNVSFTPTLGSVLDFTLKIGAVGLPAEDSSVPMSMASGDIIDFELRPAQVFLQEQESSALFVNNSGSIIDFLLKESVITYQADTDVISFIPASGTILDFTLQVTRIDLMAETDVANITPSSGGIIEFTLG